MIDAANRIRMCDFEMSGQRSATSAKARDMASVVRHTGGDSRHVPGHARGDGLFHLSPLSRVHSC